jgi:hypothetical protein
MARQVSERDLSQTLSAANSWIKDSLIEDRSAFFREEVRWTSTIIQEVYEAFVNHPDYGDDDFMTKLKKQMSKASVGARQLSAEMLWALLLFPSNMKARTKRQQIFEIWEMSGERIFKTSHLFGDDVLFGIGSGGPGFNNYRPDELQYLIELTKDLKRRPQSERKQILTEYDVFCRWIETVPRQGSRQFRHMLRYFAFPDLVERISSNNDRRKILEAFKVATSRDTANWSDKQLDEGLLKLRTKLQEEYPAELLDFYESPLKEKWRPDRTVKTLGGEVAVTVPTDDEESEAQTSLQENAAPPEARQSYQVQSSLARIGIAMGFKIWTPKNDRSRVMELTTEKERASFLESLPLNNDSATLNTIEQIDVIWLDGRWIARAFEVEHTTAVYSGLLRMADLLALQPNMDIRLHIVAPDERREKVFREMLRPVFSLLARGPLSKHCTFISYESVRALENAEHLSHMHDSIIQVYEERAEAT